MVKFLHIAVILLFGVIVMSSGCHTPTPSGPPAPKKIPSLSYTGLSGTSWRWLYSIGQYVISPGNHGYNLRMQFKSDSLFSFFRNDTLVETAQYNISADTDAYPFYSYQISFQNILLTQYTINNVLGYGYLSDAWIALQGDTLILQKKGADGFVDSYILIQ